MQYSDRQKEKEHINPERCQQKLLLFAKKMSSSDTYNLQPSKLRRQMIHSGRRWVSIQHGRWLIQQVQPLGTLINSQASDTQWLQGLYRQMDIFLEDQADQWKGRSGQRSASPCSSLQQKCRLSALRLGSLSKYATAFLPRGCFSYNAHGAALWLPGTFTCLRFACRDEELSSHLSAKLGINRFVFCQNKVRLELCRESAGLHVWLLLKGASDSMNIFQEWLR